MEILSKKPFIFIDFAHTEDGVLQVLRSLEPMKVVTVIGAGGNRDKSKRPRMARLAYELSDILILTSDNPRDEDPEEIIRDMLEIIQECRYPQPTKYKRRCPDCCYRNICEKTV